MIEVRAPAKVTLSLRVLGTRADGFHELDALTVSASSPADDLVLEDAPVTTLALSGPFAAGVPTDATNLVSRALQRRERSMAVRLRKGIPHGAGLGGGSADAAAVLRVTGGTAGDAAALGADVPFCLHGGPAWMRGRGEVLEAIAGLPPLELLLVAPEFGCATPAVYRAWDELGGPGATREVRSPAGYPGPFGNDLEAASEHVEPRLRAFRDDLEHAIGRDALLCGSGSAFVAWFDTAGAADEASGRAGERFGTTRVWRARVMGTMHE